MKDIARFRQLQPTHAEGKFRIDLTDPLTGKTKFRVEDKNHIFLESIFTSQSGVWADTVSNAWVVLNNAEGRAVDPDFPYVTGVNVGYGVPSLGSLNTIRGAYNPATQIIAQRSIQGVRWKFQYDFTVAQANGTPIDMIGVTGQYPADSRNSHFGAGKRHMSGFTALPATSENVKYTNDGRYAYVANTAGIVTRYDLWTRASIQIDVSGVVGTTSNSKYVGYAPMTGRYYIHCYSGTAAQRFLYEFSDNTFSTLLATYPLSNVTIAGPFYVNAGNMYIPSYYYIYKANYINNSAYVTLDFSQSYSKASYNEYANNSQNPEWSCGHMAHEKYLYLNSYSDGYYRGLFGAVFDLTTEKIVSNHCQTYSGQYFLACLHPLTVNTLPCISTQTNGFMFNCCAIAAKKLDTPVLKTSANGMTVTYEIEVTY